MKRFLQRLVGLALLCSLFSPFAVEQPAQGGTSINTLGGLTKPGATQSQLTEVWYSATLGSDTFLGNTQATPIKTIARLGQMFFGFGLSGSAVLYTDAPLTNSEAALFYQFSANDGRQWALVDGSLPVTPVLWYDARDINGNGDNNTGLIDGNAYSSLTWKNKGSKGSSGDATIQAGTITFRKIVSAGQLRNASALEFSGTGYFKSGAVAGLTGPSTWVAVFKVTNSGAFRMVDGRTVQCNIFFSGGSPQTMFLQGATSGTFPTQVALNQFHSLTGIFGISGVTPTGQASGCLDNTLQACTSNSGTNVADGATIGAYNDGTNKFIGQIVSLMLLDGAPAGTTDPSLFESWFRYNFGVLPQ